VVGDRADAMLGVIDKARHESVYRRIEVITGRPTAELGRAKRRRESCRERRTQREHLGRRPALGRQSRFAECLASRGRADLSTIRESCAQQAMLVPVTVVGGRAALQSSSSDTRLRVRRSEAAPSTRGLQAHLSELSEEVSSKSALGKHA